MFLRLISRVGGAYQAHWLFLHVFRNPKCKNGRIICNNAFQQRNRLKKHTKEEQNSLKMPQNCHGYFWRVQEPWLASHCCLPLMRNSYKVKMGKEGLLRRVGLQLGIFKRARLSFGKGKGKAGMVWEFSKRFCFLNVWWPAGKINIYNHWIPQKWKEYPIGTNETQKWEPTWGENKMEAGGKRAEWEIGERGGS